MLNLNTRSTQPEILDNFELEGNDLAENLRELERVNRFLGGYNIVYEGVERIIARKALTSDVRIADIGTGGGDTLKALAGWSRKKGINFQGIGIDANKSAVKYSRQQTADYSEINIQQADVFELDFHELQADIVMFNLVLHHFSDEDITRLFKRCTEAGIAVLINDLQRSFTAYQLFRLASRALRFSHIGRHDGKLSIRKSFKENDWHKLLANAGIKDYDIRWRWAFRYLVLVY